MTDGGTGGVVVPDEPPGPCQAQEDAREELSMRGITSLNILESLRDYQAALDEQYETTREDEYWKASVDVASLAAGWPMGKGAQEALLGKTADSLQQKLIKSGFKTVDKSLLKDPSLGAVFDQLRKPPTELSGLAYDEFKESIKTGLNTLFKSAGDPIIGFWDVAVLGKKVYAGMSRLDAIRAMLRDVQDRILAMEARHQADVEMLDHGVNAVLLCQQGVSHADNWRWQVVRGYLGLPEATGAPQRQPSGPTAAEGYYVFLLGENGGIGFVIATDREANTTPSCQWAGGGLDCTQPAPIFQRLSGPYHNPDQARAYLKTTLACGNGYWGAYGYVGDQKYWLQNNVTLADCLTVQQAG